MPLYEYQCDQCGRFEIIHKFADPPLAACPTCGKEVQKLLSSPAIQFKGSGWYITDYARKGESGKSESAKDSSKPSEPGKETGKEGSSTAADSSSSSPQSSPSKDSSASGSSSTK